MRVTDWMRANDLLFNMEHRLEKLSQYQNMMSSGKRINKPSDDPIGTGSALHFRHRIARNEQHQRNVEDGLNYLSYTDGVLDGVSDILNQAQAKAVQGDNGALTAEDREVLANEVNQLLEELLAKANTQFAGKYLFAGFNNETKPFEADRDDDGLITAVTQNADGIDGQIDREIGVGLRETINIGGGELFQPGGEASDDDIFQMLINLRDGLLNNDNTVIAAQIDNIANGIDNVSLHRSTIGARVNYFERRLDQLKAAEVNLTNSLSQWEDADIVEAAMMFEQEQAGYNAALAAAADVLQMSLLNYLK